MQKEKSLYPYGGTIGNALRVALGIFSGKIIYNFAFVALCGALQTPFHERGRNGKRQLQRRFLRKRSAAGALAPHRGSCRAATEGAMDGEAKKALKR